MRATIPRVDVGIAGKFNITRERDVARSIPVTVKVQRAQAAIAPGAPTVWLQPAVAFYLEVIAVSAAAAKQNLAAALDNDGWAVIGISTQIRLFINGQSCVLDHKTCS